MSENPPARAGWFRYLELGNLGLNLPLALGFLFAAAHGLPSAKVALLVIVAFLGARTAGHAFNRWTDRKLDLENPRTRDRALAAEAHRNLFPLGVTSAGAAVLLVASAFLNPLALLLAPVALVLVLGYSLTKRVGAFTTVFLGLVEAITPAGAYVAVQGTLPLGAFLAVAGILCWGTAFETIHSLGDLEGDRALGLHSLPLAFGEKRSLAVIPILHAAALASLAAWGIWAGLSWPFLASVVVIALLAGESDWRLRQPARDGRRAFRRHFAMSFLFLAGVILTLAISGAF